jgi:23S rRNA pseudouridine1911/1915/1917 synthase
VTPAEGLERVVQPAESGQRLDRFLAELVGSRSQAARLIEAGRVQVDGRAVAKRHTVESGQRVSVQARERGAASRPDAGSASVSFGVAFEDPHLIVVDKPAGLVVHPAKGHASETLVQALAGRVAGGDDPGRPGIVHRLDKDTSGLLVVAKTNEVHRALKELLAARGLHREYLALVDGLPPARTGTVEAPIGRDRRDRVLVSIDTDVPREAVTHFEVVRSFGTAALLKVVLDTGRTHQIRVHMSAIGHPVVGDRLYGGSARFGLERQFLHAARLSFPHPVTGEPVDVESALPDDLERALKLAAGE